MRGELVEINDGWDMMVVGTVDRDGVAYVVVDLFPVGASAIVPEDDAVRVFIDTFKSPFLPTCFRFEDTLWGDEPQRRHLGSDAPEWREWVRGLGLRKIDGSWDDV